MLVGYISHYLFGISIFLTSTFLIMLVLVQRGRGGGIAGALGGAGGQSAFGTKAGDLFTRITVGVATFWILLCCVAILSLRERSFSTGVDKQQAKAGAISGTAAGEAVGDSSAVAPAMDASAMPPSDSGIAAPAATSPPSDPATSDPATSDPATSDPATSDPATSDPATSDPATSDPATDDSVSDESTNEESDIDAPVSAPE